MVMKLLIWRNEASEELAQATIDLLHQEEAVLLFRGLRVRMYQGGLNANARLNKPDFGVRPVQRDSSLYEMFQQ